MGMRSQIYVRYSTNEEYGKKRLVARYFQWNYGHHMISRLRYTADWLKNNYKYLPDIRPEEDLIHILETNFDFIDRTRSINIINEIKEYVLEGKKYTSSVNNNLFFGQDNNDGVLFIDVDINGKIKYALLDVSHPDRIMDARKYIAWDGVLNDTEVKRDVEKNRKWIKENIEVMNDDDLKNFIEYDYSDSFA